METQREETQETIEAIKAKNFPKLKALYSQSNGFSSNHVWMWELDHKKDWTPKNWCFQTAVLEKTLDSHLDCKEIKPINPKGNQPWIVIWRMVAEALILWSPDSKSRQNGKDPDTGKTEDKMWMGWQRKRWLDSNTNSMDMNLTKLQEIVRDRAACCAVVHGVTKCQKWLSNWTTTIKTGRDQGS